MTITLSWHSFFALGYGAHLSFGQRFTLLLQISNSLLEFLAVRLKRTLRDMYSHCGILFYIPVLFSSSFSLTCWLIIIKKHTSFPIRSSVYIAVIHQSAAVVHILYHHLCLWSHGGLTIALGILHSAVDEILAIHPLAALSCDMDI